jgi:hypothetical protein
MLGYIILYALGMHMTFDAARAEHESNFSSFAISLAWPLVVIGSITSRIYFWFRR